MWAKGGKLETGATSECPLHDQAVEHTGVAQALGYLYCIYVM